MSYDIDLVDPVTKEVLELDSPHQMTGGTFQIGGTKELHLNITYNYGNILRKLFGEEGIRSFYGLSAMDTVGLLIVAIASLKDDVSKDYWEPTEGNVKQALLQLLTMAKLRPDGIWAGD